MPNYTKASWEGAFSFSLVKRSTPVMPSATGSSRKKEAQLPTSSPQSRSYTASSSCSSVRERMSSVEISEQRPPPTISGGGGAPVNFRGDSTSAILVPGRCFRAREVPSALARRPLGLPTDMPDQKHWKSIFKTNFPFDRKLTIKYQF